MFRLRAISSTVAFCCRGKAPEVVTDLHRLPPMLSVCREVLQAGAGVARSAWLPVASQYSRQAFTMTAWGVPAGNSGNRTVGKINFDWGTRRLCRKLRDGVAVSHS